VDVHRDACVQTALACCAETTTAVAAATCTAAAPYIAVIKQSTGVKMLATVCFVAHYTT
jgi:hypothetical protein